VFTNVNGFEEPRMVGEDDNVLRAVLAGALEFGLEPEFLFG
jgi:hypothetical protein